jgi:hypothetical protein
MRRRFVVFALALAAFCPALLLVDTPGLIPQLALGVATLLFLVFFARRCAFSRREKVAEGRMRGVDPRQIIVAIAIATTGEILLSVVWGLYAYRNALIPLYVPFGHGILYALAAESAEQPLFGRYRDAITRGVLAGGTLVAIASLILLDDQWGMLWWIGAALLMIRARNPLMLSVCFVYASALESLGTAIGNWRWMPIVPHLGLRCANPPSGVGILYVLLDVTTVMLTAAFAARPSTSPTLTPELSCSPPMRPAPRPPA